MSIADLTAENIAKLLGGEERSGQVLAPGPGHSEDDRSLSIKLDKDAPEGFVVNSFAGDDPIVCRDYVCEKLGLPDQNENKRKGASNWTLVSDHIYRTADAHPYLRVRKMRDENGKKQYPQSHWDGRQWIRGAPKTPKIPYRLPELIAAPITGVVYFCEGEKDCDNLAKLGFITTTQSGGAAASWDNALTKHFKDRHVVVVPDADAVGRKHGQKVAKALNGVAASVRVLDLYPERRDGSDVSDWLADDPAGVKLAAFAKEAPLWEPSTETGEGEGHVGDDDSLIVELAALTQLEYAKRRRDAAKRLGVDAPLLDQLVKTARRTLETGAADSSPLYDWWDVAPWDEPVDGSALLADLIATIQRYVFLSKDQAIAVALWVIFTWCHAAMTHSPILFVTSAEPESGKTTLLGTLGFLVRRGMPSVEISGPALFRSIKKWEPCFIVDEADEAFNKNPDLRSVVNSGWTRGTGVVRCAAETHDPELFSTFAPKAIGMKGRGLPDTTLSRSIVIEMKPRRPDDPAEKIADFDHVDNEVFQRLRSQISRWTADNIEALTKVVPETPLGFHNRRRANWKPLLAIAEQIGGNWGAAARKAALAIEAVHDAFDRSIGVELLAAIREIFTSREADRITSKALVDALVEDQTGPWVAYGRNQKPINEHGVARLLKPYRIKPRTIRISEEHTAKGYLLASFEDAFDRHLARSARKASTPSVTPSQASTVNGFGENPPVTSDLDVTAGNQDNPLKNDTCDGVTVQNEERAPTEDAAVARRCVQCGADPDGSEQQCGFDDLLVWLHPACQHPYMRGLEERERRP